MLVKLKNASEKLEGYSVVINADVIISIYEAKEEETEKLKTYIFCGQYGTWEVQESVEEVYSLISV